VQSSSLREPPARRLRRSDRALLARVGAAVRAPGTGGAVVSRDASFRSRCAA